MKTSLSILSSLAEPTRLSAMKMLWDGREHCVCELMEALNVSQSRMSRHMAALKAAGLVVDQRRAQWVFYRLSPSLSKPVLALVEAALNLETPAKRKCP